MKSIIHKIVLEECKYMKKKNIKSKNYVDMELKSKSNSDSDSDRDSSNGIYIDNEE